VSSPDWSATDAHHDEYVRLHTAGEHVARAVAELQRAMQQVGDHASAVALSEAIENLQLTQAQLATAAERAYSLAELARRSARHAAFQRQFDAATRQGHTGLDDWLLQPPPATPDDDASR
jgi:hypothetical protein